MSTIVPFGPQHPVLPEPIQLCLELEDERVVSVIPVVGYVHRGLEKIAEKKDFIQDTYLIERICGICSFIHSMTYCMGIEELMSLPVPPRALYLRVVWSELHRIHSHLLALGLLADAFGFENLFMQYWRSRERIMDAMEYTTGGRVMLSSCCIGGVRRDINDEQKKFVLDQLKEVEKEVASLNRTMMEDYSVRRRMVGIGILTKETAFARGAVGPTARGSGVVMDRRLSGYAAYGDLEFEPVVENDGDCCARTMVRCREVMQSIDLVRKALAKLPESELKTPFKGNPTGEAVIRSEQPRGEVLYFLRGNGTDKLERLRVRTPTFANIPAMLAMLQNCQLPDVGVIIISVDPCVSCTER